MGMGVNLPFKLPSHSIINYLLLIIGKVRLSKANN